MELTEQEFDIVMALNKVLSLNWNTERYQMAMVRVLRDHGYDLRDLFKVEGYWRGSIGDESKLPWPESDQYSEGSIQLFLPLLKIVERKAERSSYLGYSMCRICGKRNGTNEFWWQGWKWPAGLTHYIEEHGVAPTTDFVKFITEESGKVKSKK